MFLMSSGMLQKSFVLYFVEGLCGVVWHRRKEGVRLVKERKKVREETRGDIDRECGLDEAAGRGTGN